LLGKDFHDFLDRMDQDNFFLYFRKVTVEHLHSVIRLRIHSCNDRPVWVELSSTPMLVEGGCYGSQIVITDISQRIVMEQELITSHDYLNSLVDNLTVGVGILVGPDFRYSRVNATLAEMNGISIEGHFGKKFVEVLPHAAPSLMPELTHVFNTGKPSAQRDHCTRLPDQPDKDRWFLDSFFPIAVTEGQPKAVGYMSLEITERKNLEQEILDISEQERRRLGIEIHDDLGQLLTGIGFMAEELAQTLGKKGLKLEAERVNLMANLIADATKKARNLSQSFYPVELESVSFASTLTALALRTEEMYDVRCVVQIGEPIDILSKASILSLYHIVREAVSNAVRHASPTRIDINVTLERDLLLVSVKDDGSLKPQTLSRSEGIGRRIMQYRADLLSATLDSSHVAGRGTIVSCYMKLPYFPHSPSPEVNG
jgi:signal transduction histidine kinase